MTDNGDREGRFPNAFVGGFRENDSIRFTQLLTLIHCQLFLGNSTPLVTFRTTELVRLGLKHRIERLFDRPGPRAGLRALDQQGSQ